MVRLNGEGISLKELIEQRFIPLETDVGLIKCDIRSLRESRAELVGKTEEIAKRLGREQLITV